MQIQRITLGGLALCAAFLTACGGNSDEAGSSGPIKSTLTFPLQAGYKKWVDAGSSVNYRVSGTCSGTSTISESKPTATTFENAPALATTYTATTSVSNCTPSQSSSTQTAYYSATYAPVGNETTGQSYAAPTADIAIPSSVRVGESAVLGRLNVYSSSAKTTLLGSIDLSYVIEADTASTAIVNLVSKRYNTSNQWLLTSQLRYRMAADGSLTALSVSTLNVNGVQLLFTPF